MSEGSSEADTRVKYSLKIKLRHVIPVAIATLILFITSLLPPVIEHVAESWLQEHGVESASIDNVDLNLFTGTVVLEGLQAGDGLNITRLAVNVDWLPLFRRIVHIRSFELQTSNIALHQNEQEQWQLASIKLDQLATEQDIENAEALQSEPWIVIVDDLGIEELLLNVNGKALKMRVPVDSLHLNLSGLLESEQSLEAELKLGETDFTGFGYQVSGSALQLAGKLLFSVNVEDVIGSLKAEGAEVEFEGLKLYRNNGKKLAAVDTLELSGVNIASVSRHRVASIRASEIKLSPLLTGAGSLSLATVDVDRIDVDTHGQTSLASLRLTKLKSNAMLNADSDISLQSLNIQKLSMQQNKQINLASLQLKKLQARALSDVDDEISLQGLELQALSIEPEKSMGLESLAMQGFSFMQQQGKQKLAVIEELSLNKFAMLGADQGSFEQLDLNGIELPASGGKSLGAIGSIAASGATMGSSGRYHLKQLQFTDLNARLIKQKSGSWRVLDDLERHQQSRSTKEPVTAGEKKSAAKVKKSTDPVVIIDELLIADGSKVFYRDESVSPPFDARMTVKRFRFAPLDLSGKRDGRLDMLMAVGKYGSLSAKGNIRPGTKNLRTDLAVILKNIDMHGLSGFIESDFGKSIQTGQLNLNSDINISHDKIISKNRLLIRKLELGDSKQTGKAEQRIGMPVNMALDMLRGDRGDIEMEVPISGDLDDPNININAIINKALMSSLSTGAMTYGMLVLQPYGSIVFAADLASDLIKEAVKPKLTPIVFDELETGLNPSMTEYVSKISELLKKSEHLRLQVCGVAMRFEGEPVARPAVAASNEGKPAEQEDTGMDDEALLLLGQARADTVMRALQQHGIDAERLFSCRANIDDTVSGVKPRVELILD